MNVVKLPVTRDLQVTPPSSQTQQDLDINKRKSLVAERALAILKIIEENAPLLLFKERILFDTKLQFAKMLVESISYSAAYKGKTRRKRAQQITFFGYFRTISTLAPALLMNARVLSERDPNRLEALLEAFLMQLYNEYRLPFDKVI